MGGGVTELFAEAAQGVLHAAEGGIDGDTLEFGDGFKGDIGLHAEDKDFALLGGKGGDGGADAVTQFAVGGVGGGVETACGKELFEGEGCFAGAERGLEAGVGLFFAAEIDDPVAGDAEEPGHDVAAVEAVEVFEGAEPDILEDVFGGVRVADHAIDVAVQGTAGPLHERVKGGKVACLRGCQQVFKGGFLQDHGVGERNGWAGGILSERVEKLPEGAVGGGKMGGGEGGPGGERGFGEPEEGGEEEGEIAEEDEGVGAEGTHVVEIGLAEAESEGGEAEVVGPGDAEEEGKPGEPGGEVEPESGEEGAEQEEEAVEGKHVGGEGDPERAFADFDVAAVAVDGDAPDAFAAGQGGEGVAEFVGEDVESDGAGEEAEGEELEEAAEEEAEEGVAVGGVELEGDELAEKQVEAAVGGGKEGDAEQAVEEQAQELHERFIKWR